MKPETLQKLTEQLKRHEQSNKVALKPYRCPKGKLTIGWGHNYQDKPLIPDIALALKLNGSITPVMADRQLYSDIKDAEADAQAHCEVYEKLDEVRKAVIVNMIFNLGHGFLIQSSEEHYWPNFNRHLNALDFDGAAHQMHDALWYRQLGGDPEGTDDGILERPEELIAMMKTGEWRHG